MNQPISDHFLSRYRSLLDAEDLAFDELEHACEEGDRAQFDWWAQAFASRGYAVFQPNYRGTLGYGEAFRRAAEGQFGRKMQTDISDGVAALAKAGIVDPRRACIVGASYGGYAALVGASFTPDLFCCAVDIVGPSNLKTLIESIPPYWAPEIEVFHQRVGNPETEEAFLWSRSPLSRAR